MHNTSKDGKKAVANETRNKLLNLSKSVSEIHYIFTARLIKHNKLPTSKYGCN